MKVYLLWEITAKDERVKAVYASKKDANKAKGKDSIYRSHVIQEFVVKPRKEPQ